MKKGKELKINLFDNYKTVYGSVNNKNAKALYVNISAWAEPKFDGEINYNRIIRNVGKGIKQTVYNLVDINDLVHKDKIIVDFDIRESGVKYGKKSFTNCEITFFTKEEIHVNSDKLKIYINNIVKKLINNIFENNEYFNFYKKKI